MILLTIATDPVRAVPLLRSAEARGFLPIVLGAGRRFREPSDGVGYLRDALSRLDGLVLFTHGYDSVILGTPAEVRLGFESYKQFVLFAAERNCNPDRLASDHPPAPTPYRYLNAGGFVGRAADVLDVYTAMSRTPYSDEQTTVGQYYIDNPDHIALDVHCRVFQCLHTADNDINYPTLPSRPTNAVTGTTPSVFHGNRKSNLGWAKRWEGNARGEAKDQLPAGHIRLDPTTTLHLITPCSRHQNLAQISRHLDSYHTACEFHWWVAIDPKLPAALPRPKGAHAFRAKAGGACGAHGRNQCLDMIDDGWVAFLDDDTLPHPDLPAAIFEAAEMYPHALAFCFSQLSADGRPRVTGKHGEMFVDTGVIVFRREAVGSLRWRSDAYNHDQIFFAQFVETYPGRTVWVDRVVSWYNKLRRK